MKHQRRTQRMLVESSLSSSGRREEERPQESRAHTDRIELAGYVSHQPAGQPAGTKNASASPSSSTGRLFVCVFVTLYGGAGVNKKAKDSRRTGGRGSDRRRERERRKRAGAGSGGAAVCVCRSCSRSSRFGVRRSFGGVKGGFDLSRLFNRSMRYSWPWSSSSTSTERVTSNGVCQLCTWYCS